jgi:hypothetical protein
MTGPGLWLELTRLLVQQQRHLCSVINKRSKFAVIKGSTAASRQAALQFSTVGARLFGVLGLQSL